MWEMSRIVESLSWKGVIRSSSPAPDQGKKPNLSRDNRGLPEEAGQGSFKHQFIPRMDQHEPPKWWFVPISRWNKYFTGPKTTRPLVHIEMSIIEGQ